MVDPKSYVIDTEGKTARLFQGLMLSPENVDAVQMVVGVSMSSWVCLIITASWHHGDKNAVIKDIHHVFGEDIVEVRVVCDDRMEESGEYFVFVKCHDYWSHLSSLKASSAFLQVIQSFDNPSFLTDKEVDGFSDSVEKHENKEHDSLIYGDIVKVRESELEKQHLTRLTGIVVSLPGDDAKKGKIPLVHCGVFFRLHSECFIEILPVTSLDFVGNIIEQIRVSPFRSIINRVELFGTERERARKAVAGIVSSDTLHRKRRRAHEAVYNS